MKFDIYDLKEIIEYNEKIINALIDQVNVNSKKDLPFTLRYEGEYIKRVVIYGKVKTIHLEYFSSFLYLSRDGSFQPIRKPYIRMLDEIPYKNKLKEKFALITTETKFCERIVHGLFAVIALGQGCIDFKGILNGTAELGVNEKSTPLEIIKERQNES